VDLAKKVGEALAVARQDRMLVTAKVLDGLKMATVLVLDLVATLVGLTNLIKKVTGVAVQVLNWLRNRVADFVVWLLRKLGLVKGKGGPGCPVGTGKGGTGGRGTGPGTCFAWDTWTRTGLGLRRVGELDFPCLVATFSPQERWRHPAAPRLLRDPEQLRVLCCSLEEGDGNRVAVKLLRRVEWLRENQVTVGGLVWLDRPEMGVQGWATVTAVGPCPPLPEGEGEMVTGLFHHRRGQLCDLCVEGELRPIGVTPTHPFWSVDRDGWVPAGELRSGERLQGWDRVVEVRSLNWREHEEPVYNLEVDSYHVYRVGELGLLVHNSSAPCHPCDLATQNHYLPLYRGGRSYSAMVDSFISPSGQRQVCRVRRIDGVVLATTPGGSQMARAAMRATIFGGPPPVYIPSAAQPTNYDAGHLIADEFGGPNEVGNLVPIRTVVNVGGAWRQMENWIKRCLRQPGVTGIMDVTVTYDQSASGVDKYIPTSISVRVRLSTTPTTSTTHTFTIANAPSATFQPPTTCV
jgi:hypothetical protein